LVRHASPRVRAGRRTAKLCSRVKWSLPSLLATVACSHLDCVSVTVYCDLVSDRSSLLNKSAMLRDAIGTKRFVLCLFRALTDVMSHEIIVVVCVMLQDVVVEPTQRTVDNCCSVNIYQCVCVCHVPAYTLKRRRCQLRNLPTNIQLATVQRTTSCKPGGGYTM
jgi:hypothetical protein